MLDRKSLSGGSAVLEFTLVGIPLMFLLISVFEVSRGMWLYHTMASAVKEGARYAIVHGNNCTLTPSNCAVTIRDVSQRIRDYAIGFVPTDLINVTFTSSTRTITCPTLNACLQSGASGDTYWPAASPTSASDSGGDPSLGWVEITAQYRFQSAIAMFWPGAGSGQNFGTFVFPASSRETIQF